ncbi:hypothetical protein DF029_20265 [Burkholderia cepacia]|nr:hypothetical protein DF029_20265 [Burkholderia cepacia]
MHPLDVFTRPQQWLHRHSPGSSGATGEAVARARTKRVRLPRTNLNGHAVSAHCGSRCAIRG